MGQKAYSSVHEVPWTPHGHYIVSSIVHAHAVLLYFDVLGNTQIVYKGHWCNHSSQDLQPSFAPSNFMFKNDSQVL